MAKKKLSEYELSSVLKTINALSGPQALIATALARRFLPIEDLEKFENQKRLEQVLALAATPEELKLGFSKIDWDQTENACNIIFSSANPDAVDLAPIQWWDSPNSQVYDADHSYFATALYSSNAIENEWLPRYFFNCRAYHAFSNIRITHNFGGEVVGAEMQKAVWKSLKNKGLTGSTTIESSAFCGVPANRKVLDVCLVYTSGFEYIDELIQSTNWNQTNTREDTLFALGALYLADKGDFKLVQNIAQYFEGHTFDFNQKYGGGRIKFQDKIINRPEEEVSLGMSALRTVIGSKLPENLTHVKHQVLEYYTQLAAEEQDQVAHWFYNNQTGRNAAENIRNLKELMKHSSSATVEGLLQRIAYDQWEDHMFVDGYDHQPEMTELAGVLKQFSAHKKSILDQEFLQQVVELGKEGSLYKQDMGAVQYIKSWCKHPETLLELMTTYTRCSTNEEITSWVEASKMRIELLDVANKTDKKQKRKI